MASIDLVSNLLPGVLSAEGRRLEQQATPAQPVGQSLLGGISGLGSVAPAASQQKRNLAGLFGGLTGRDIDVRSPTEKINAQLAQSGADMNTSAGLLEAAKLTNAAGMSQQALQLSALANVQKKKETAVLVSASSNVKRIQAAIENTTDPRIKKELEALLPSAMQGLLAGADLTTAIDKTIERYKIEPLTKIQMDSLGRLVDEDAELRELIEKPGFWSKMFGSEDPKVGREQLIRAIGNIQQTNPGISDEAAIDFFLEQNKTRIKDILIEGEGNLSALPLETVSLEPAFVPAGQSMTGEEQRDFLEKQKADTQQKVAEINRLVQAQLDEEDRQGRRPRTTSERRNRADELRVQRARQLGLDLSPGRPQTISPVAL
jgi:hypothetical protein